MGKITLELEEDFDFKLFGISCHSKDYRLSFELDKSLAFDFIKEENLEIKLKEGFAEFSFYSYIDEENYTEYFLLSNRGTMGYLVPEEKLSDYFLLIKGSVNNEIEILKKINEVKLVLKAYTIKVEELKSKRNLIF
jgi:hypothetical protein